MIAALLNPWVLVVWGGSIAAAGFYGYGLGQDREIADQSRVAKAIEAAGKEAADKAAQQIGQIKVKHTTIRQNAAKEIIRDPIYLDCNHPDAVRRLLDSALANGAAASAPAGGGKLPAADAAR